MGPVQSKFGGLACRYGTVVSSAVGLPLAGFAGVFLAEFAPRQRSTAIGMRIEGMARGGQIVAGLFVWSRDVTPGTRR